MVTVTEMFEDMVRRCAEVKIFDRLPDADDQTEAMPMAFGAIVRIADEGWLAVEVSQSFRGEASVQVQAFTAEGERKALSTFSLDEVVMVSSD